MNVTFVRKKGHSKNTLKLVAEKLKEYTVKSDIVTENIKPQTRILFRWGCTTSVQNSPPSYKGESIHTVINRREKIQLAFDKGVTKNLLSLIDLSNRAITLQELLVLKQRGDELQYVVRPNNHQQGRNFYVAETITDVNNLINMMPDAYATPLIRKEKEYRIYIFMNTILAVTEKIPNDKNDIVWNFENKTEFINIKWSNWDLDICSKALQAAHLLHLQWTAIDIAKDTDGKIHVFELNTAPSLSDYRAGLLAKALALDIMAGALQPRHLVYTPKNYKSIIHAALRPIK